MSVPVPTNDGRRASTYSLASGLARQNATLRRLSRNASRSSIQTCVEKREQGGCALATLALLGLSVWLVALMLL